MIGKVEGSGAGSGVFVVDEGDGRGSGRGGVLGVDDYIAAKEIAVAKNKLKQGLAFYFLCRWLELAYTVFTKGRRISEFSHDALKLFLEDGLSRLLSISSNREGKYPFLHHGPQIWGSLSWRNRIDSFDRRL